MSNEKEWYWRDAEWNSREKEFTVTLRVSKKFLDAARLVSESLRYKSFENWVSDVVKMDARKELIGAGSLNCEQIEEINKKLLEAE